MTWPLFRMASALTRPLMAAKVLDVRTTWTIGSGPWPTQVPPRALPLTVSLAMPEACLLAFSRNAAAWSTPSWLSPASSLLE